MEVERMDGQAETAVVYDAGERRTHAVDQGWR
jgi:hypothetical protein